MMKLRRYLLGMTRAEYVFDRYMEHFVDVVSLLWIYNIHDGILGLFLNFYF